MNQLRDNENAAVASIFLLVSRLLNEEITPQLRDILVEPAVLDCLAQANPEVRDYLTKNWSGADYEEAAVAYCDTFILPEKSASPRAVAWLFEGDHVTADGIHAVVESILQKKQITLPDSLELVPFDHASVLLHVAATLRLNNDDQAAEFENAVFGSWLNRFGEELLRRDHCFYRSVGSIVSSL